MRYSTGVGERGKGWMGGDEGSKGRGGWEVMGGDEG